MEILEELDEIGAQAVLSMRPRVGREDRHHVEVDRARASGHDAGERVKLGRFSRDGSRELLPGRGQPLERDAAEGAALRVFELDTYRGRPVRAAARQKADGVALAVPDADAAEALVADAELPRRRCHAEVVRVRGARGRRGLDRETSGRVGERRAAPAHERIGELERAVLHSLGIDAAVGREVDVLEEDTEERRRDCGAGTIDGDGDLHRRRVDARGAGDERQGQCGSQQDKVRSHGRMIRQPRGLKARPTVRTWVAPNFSSACSAAV